MNIKVNLTQEVTARLIVACRYWEMAKNMLSIKSGSSHNSAYYYSLAYNIISKEIGNNHPVTLELLAEMAG